MSSIFAPQFGVSAPYQPEPLPTGTPSIGINLPRKPPNRKPSEEPNRTPSRNPNSEPNAEPKAEPKSISHGNNLWNDMTRFGADAVGLGASALSGVSRNPVGEAEGILRSAEPDLAPVINAGRNLGSQFEGIGSDIVSGAKGVNSFLESTSGGGGLTNAVNGTGDFAPGATSSPLSGFSDLKAPDTIGNIASDAADILFGKSGFELAA